MTAPSVTATPTAVPLVAAAGTLAELVESLATPYVFFTGKGGVGKTSTACATAVALADLGCRVLLVSTDPASNLDDVLAAEVGTSATPVPGAAGLAALNVDPVQAAAAYRERVVGPYRGVLPDSAIAGIEEQLSGACTVEIAAFDEFTALLADPDLADRYDHVVFDTAPTGHTLRLLALPAAWTSFIGDGTGTSCLGPLSGLVGQRDRYAAAVDQLTDPTRTTLVLVTRPDPAALAEADRAGADLRGLGIASQRLIVNGVFTATPGGDDPLATALHQQSQAALAGLPTGLADLPRTVVPLMVDSPLGPDGLRRLTAPVDDAPAIDLAAEDAAENEDGSALQLSDLPGSASFASLVDDIAAAGSGLVMTMGKGGVGKTTTAAAVAVALAARGHQVQLSTTDPAAHLTAALGQQVPGITVSRIDPVAETSAYTAEVLAGAGAGLAADARAVLEEDLASPCTEEIAVFQAFARTVEQAQDGFVVLDTAPTGHTLLLLDAARTYTRELDRQTGQLPSHVVHLLDRLRNPARTHVLLVALPETTPVHEAAALQADLQRSGITPAGWVLNQSLLAARPTDPLLRARAAHESIHLRQAARHTSRLVVLPRTPQPPVGPDLLRDLVGQTELVGQAAR